MLNRRQDMLFSDAARLALRGAHAARDGDKPSSLKPLLESWDELEIMVRMLGGPRRKVGDNLLTAARGMRAIVASKAATNDDFRRFGQACVLIFKLGRGDDPARYPLEFGDYF